MVILRDPREQRENLEVELAKGVSDSREKADRVSSKTLFDPLSPPDFLPKELAILAKPDGVGYRFAITGIRGQQGSISIPQWPRMTTMGSQPL